MKTDQEIFSDLMQLCEKNDAFSWKDFISPSGGTFRIFQYRLASYTDFLEPSAFECRGIMFLMEDDKMIRIASRTQPKFFNAYENPFTMFDSTVLCSDIEQVLVKMDGSLISTYTDIDFKVRAKSHGSINSEHAINSTLLMQNDPVFYNELSALEALGWTTNLEYTSPEYRIVLPYQKDELTVLNVRNRKTGEYLSTDELKLNYPKMYSMSVLTEGDICSTFPIRGSLKESIDEVRGYENIEGFVLRLKDGRVCKIKTDWYCSLHFTKDSINVDSRLYEAVLNKASDDLKQLFATDEYSIKKILKMEQLVFSCYNDLVHDVETFVANNKHLERKAFALKAQNEVSKSIGRLYLVFNLYNGHEVDYKSAMLKHMKDVLNGF